MLSMFDHVVIGDGEILVTDLIKSLSAQVASFRN